MGASGSISESSRKKFGELVRTQRGHHTQVKFAESCNISQGALSKIEQGHVGVPLKALQAIAERLGLREHLHSATVAPPMRWAVCENVDCPSVLVDYCGDDLLFIPKLFQIRDGLTECPFGHPLNSLCRKCKEPLGPSSRVFCSNKSCRRPLFDRSDGILGRYSSRIIAAWDELEALRRESDMPTAVASQLPTKADKFMALIAQEQARRSKLVALVIDGDH